MLPRAYLSSLEQFGIKLGLDQIRALVRRLDHPDRAFDSIVVAGTNGKGSVTAMVERGLRAAGRRTGRYISPHLVALEERFAVNGVDVDAATVDAAIRRIGDAAAGLEHPPSYFEATTAMALEIFREAAVDVAVLEVGLGGRLDATNVVTPIAVAITAIDLDHQAHLGDTIEAIAAEKAGVIKAGGLVVLGRNGAAARGVVAARARDVGAELLYAPDDVEVTVAMEHGRARCTFVTPRATYGDVLLALRGRHQVDNALVAVRLLEEMSARRGIALPQAAVRAALEDVIWPARLELMRWQGVEILIDGAHNPAGAQALAEYVAATYGRRLPFVIGVMKDKAIADILRALAPLASRVVFTTPGSDRAAAPEALVREARVVAPDLVAEAIAAPAAAMASAAAHGSPVVVAGSLYLAGEVRALVG